MYYKAMSFFLQTLKIKYAGEDLEVAAVDHNGERNG